MKCLDEQEEVRLLDPLLINYPLLFGNSIYERTVYGRSSKEGKDLQPI